MPPRTSRLNRTHPSKEEIFVLGLANDAGSPVTVRVVAISGTLAERGLRAYFGLCQDVMVTEAGMPKNPFVGAIVLDETGTYFPPLPVWLSRHLRCAGHHRSPDGR